MDIVTVVGDVINNGFGLCVVYWLGTGFYGDSDGIILGPD